MPEASRRHRFVDLGNGTVSDLDTGLMWQQGELAEPRDWTNAIRHAEELVLGGFSDWRLPNLKELESLNDLEWFLLDRMLQQLLKEKESSRVH